MPLLENILLVIVIVWVALNLASARSNARKGETVFLPAYSSTLVLSIMIVITIASGLSRLHLLWMFPLSFVLGIILLAIPFTATLIIGSVAILSWPLKNHKK
jgi:hypothetical protein